jgi:hypothetical protein
LVYSIASQASMEEEEEEWRSRRERKIPNK